MPLESGFSAGHELLEFTYKTVHVLTCVFMGAGVVILEYLYWLFEEAYDPKKTEHHSAEQ